MNSFPFPRFILAVLILIGLGCWLAPQAHAQLASQLYGDAIHAYKAGDVAEAKRKLRLTLEVDKNFRPASAMLNQINLAEQQTPGSGQNPGAVPVSIKILERLTFPVEFKETSLQTALEFIRQQVETASSGKAQVNFVLQIPAELANKRISLQLNHVPVTEMLRYISDLAGVSFQIQKYAIAVVPAGNATASPGATPAGALHP